MSEPFISISELSKQLGIPAHTLRYWEREFPAAIKPATGAGGRRYYRAETVAALARIKELLYSDGYTIAGVKKLIAGGEIDAHAPVRPAALPAVGIRPASAPDISRVVELLEKAKLELAPGAMG